jgi:hypothetical protein
VTQIQTIVLNLSEVINLVFNIVVCWLGKTTVIFWFRIWHLVLLDFHLAELQLFTSQIYNTETSDLSSGS